MYYDDYEDQMNDSFATGLTDFSNAKTDKNTLVNIGETIGMGGNQYFMEDAQYSEMINERKYHDQNLKIIKAKAPEYEDYYNSVMQLTYEQKKGFDEAIKTGSLNSAFSIQDKGRLLLNMASGKKADYRSLNDFNAYKKIKELEQQHDLKLYTLDEVRKNAVRDVENQRVKNDVRRKQQSSFTGDLIGGFAAAIDPLNLATMFVPVGGQYAAAVKYMDDVVKTGGSVAKTATGFAAMDVAGNIVKADTKGFLKDSLEAGAKGAAIGTVAEIYNQYNHVMPYRSEYLGDNYTSYDVATNVGFAAAGGLLLGTLFEGFANIRGLRKERNLGKELEDFETLLNNSVKIKQEYNFQNPDFLNAFEQAAIELSKNGEKRVEMHEVFIAAKQLYESDKMLDDLFSSPKLLDEGKVDFQGRPLIKDEVVERHAEATATAILQYNATGEVKVENIVKEDRIISFSDKIDQLTTEGNPTGIEAPVYEFLKSYKEEIKENMKYSNIDELLDDVDRFFAMEERAKFTLGEQKYNDIIMNDKDLEDAILDYKLENPNANSFELKRVIADYVNDIIELEEYRNASVIKIPENNLTFQNKKINNELKKDEILNDDEILEILNTKSSLTKYYEYKSGNKPVDLTEEDEFLFEALDEFGEDFDFVDDFGIIESENKALDDFLECAI